MLFRIAKHASRLALAATVGAHAAGAQTAYLNADFGVRASSPEFLYVNNPTPTLLHSFFWDVTGPIDYITPTLLSGRAYHLRISGRAGVGPLDGTNYNNSMPDAAFQFCGFFQNLDTCQVPIDYTANWVTGWDGFAGRRPSPDVYNPLHVYDYFVAGLDAGLRFTYADNPYSDNRGGFNVVISELGMIVAAQPVPEPRAGLLILAAGSVFIVVRRRREHAA